MLVLTTPIAWENDPAVRQILVFPNAEVEASFMRSYNDPNRMKTTADFPSENGIGALFKLRAVRNGAGSWDAVVRCGFTGGLLLESTSVGPPDDEGWEAALRVAMNLLRNAINFDLRTKAELNPMKELVPNG